MEKICLPSSRENVSGLYVHFSFFLLLIKCESVSDMKKDQTGAEKGDINKNLHLY